MVVKLLTRKKYFLSIIITISQTHKTKQQQKHAIVIDNKPKDFDYQESTNNTESSKRMVISKYALKWF